MAVTHDPNVPRSLENAAPQRSRANRLILPGVEVIRGGRVEPFLGTRPALSSTAVHWGGIALDNYAVPAVLIPRHEHPEDFLHLVLRGSVKYEVSTGGRLHRFAASPGTVFILPRGTVDEIRWEGPTRRIAVAIHPRLLTNALDDAVRETDIELTEHWNLTDRHISALLVEMTADLEDGSPAGKIYGESLTNTLAVHLLNRYAVRRQTPIVYKGGLPGHRLKRVLDYIANNLAENLSLSQLATVAGMSVHYFSELFRQSTGRAPHHYVLSQRIERAKQQLRDPERSIIEAGLDAGFQNPSHFARMFRKLVGTTPSRFRADAWSGQAGTSPSGKLDHLKMRQVQEFIEEHLGDNLTLVSLANVAGVSSSYFSHLFRNSLGVAPHQYLLKRRLDRARDLLQNNRQRIAEIASATGFSDQSHLTRHFKRQFGVTPQKCREK